VIVLLAALLAQDKEWFPVEKGTTWTYIVGANELTLTARGAGKAGDIECVKLEWSSGGADSQTEFFQVDDKGVSLLKVETWRNETQGEMAQEPAIPRLRFSTKKGESWEWAAKDGKSKATYTNAGEEEITVAAGKFMCIKIHCDAGNEQGKYTVDRWYAKGIGVVKQVLSLNNETRELKKFEKPSK